jgi:predicted dehydrogenase
MKQLLMKNGVVGVVDVPAPGVQPGSILVAVDYSCISVGTEISGLKSGGDPLWRRAQRSPEQVRAVVSLAKEQGLKQVYEKVTKKLDTALAIGYSLSGVVVDVGAKVTEFVKGDRVACAGAQCAHHAEVVCIPKNLAVKVPSSVDMAGASTVTLGAIALQSVRRCNPTLGETVVVLGLGILGQILVQLLKANGVTVVAIDLDSDRIALATKCGADFAILPTESDPKSIVNSLTDGHGADAVIIAASTTSDEVVSDAFKLCRKKARVVLLGDVGLDIRREDIYVKELDFLVSTSYGPGRYDPDYEENGHDYPLAYVRWTENRNMGQYLSLLEQGKIVLDNLITSTTPLIEAPDVYAKLKQSGTGLIALLAYPGKGSAELLTRTTIPTIRKSQKNDRIRVGIVGASGFAKAMHLPNLVRLKNKFEIHAIMSRSGHNALEVSRQFNAQYATTDYEEMLSDKDCDAIIIATRHNLHADQVVRALEAGKHVLVEKPLALNLDELRCIEEFYQANPKGPLLLTGFNRRFSSHARVANEVAEARKGPFILNYRMNAGYIPLDHWVHGEEGGGRNIGEACHLYDLFTYLANSECVDVQASAITPASTYHSRNDNFIATLGFKDGSVATLTYTALGSSLHPKEQFDLYVDGQVVSMNNYKSTVITGRPRMGVSTKFASKGQYEELVAFGNAINTGGDWPIPLWQQMQASKIAIQIEKLISGGLH